MAMDGPKIGGNVKGLFYIPETEEEIRERIKELYASTDEDQKLTTLYIMQLIEAMYVAKENENKEAK